MSVPLRLDPGLFTTLTGHHRWLLWIGIIPFLLVTAAFRIWIDLSGLNSERFETWTMLPIALLLPSTVIVIGLFWALGARHALALGYDRTTVFWTTFGLSIALTFAHFTIALATGYAWNHMFIAAENLGFVSYRLGLTGTYGNEITVYGIAFTIIFLVAIAAFATVIGIAGLRKGLFGVLSAAVLTVVGIIGTGFVYVVTSLLIYGFSGSASPPFSWLPEPVFVAVFLSSVVWVTVHIAQRLFTQVRA